MNPEDLGGRVYFGGDLPSVGTEDAPSMANYTFTIVADSGYESTTEGRCSAKQYGAVIYALHNDASYVEQRDSLAAERDELASRVRELEGALWGCIAAIERTHHCTEADRLASAEAARAALAAQPGAAGEPVASIYVNESGEREFDDWLVPLPVGRNELYTSPLTKASQPEESVIEQASRMLHKYHRLCVEVGRGDSYWLGEILATEAALRSAHPSAAASTEAKPAQDAVDAAYEACAQIAFDADHMGSVNMKLMKNRIGNAIRAAISAKKGQP